MKGTHCQLGSRLADGLGSDDTNRFTDLHHAAMGKIAPIALHTGATLAPAGEDRADMNSLQAGLLDPSYRLLVDFIVFLDQHFISDWIFYGFKGYPAQNTFAQTLDNLSSLSECLHPDAVNGAAVFLVNNGILGHINQPPSQISRVGGLQGGVCQPFSRSVGGNEILQHRKTLAEVSGNGGFDNLTRRFGHKTTHSRKLAHLILASSRA